MRVIFRKVCPLADDSYRMWMVFSGLIMWRLGNDMMSKDVEKAKRD